MQPVCTGDQASDQEVLTRHRGYPAGKWRGEYIIRIRIARPLGAGQLQTSHRVRGEISLSEVIGIIKVDRDKGTTEPGQQITAIVPSAGAHHDLRADIRAGLRQR